MVFLEDACWEYIIILKKWHLGPLRGVGNVTENNVYSIGIKSKKETKIGEYRE